MSGNFVHVGDYRIFNELGCDKAMGVMNIWPLVMLITIPLVVLLYILKRKDREIEVSSSFLWKEAYKNTKADTPWEKLKVNIMMILQIIIFLLIILSLMKPFLNFGGRSYKNLIIVMDTTASMSTLYEDGKSRLDKGKEEAAEYIKSLNEDTENYLVSFKGNSDFQLEQNMDDIKQSYGSGDIKNCLSYVKSLSENLEEAEVLVITDQNVDLGDLNGRVVSLASSGKNAAVINVSHKMNDDTMRVIATVKNTGDEDYSGDFSLYNGENLLEADNVSLGIGESKTLDFSIENFEGEYLKGELSAKDMIEGDNTYYDVINKNNLKKVLLVTEKNVFLEKSFNNIENIELYKTSDLNNIGEEKYDLYVFDNIMPEGIPDSGNILFINPDSNELFEAEYNEKVTIVNGNPEELSSYLKDMKFTVSKYKKINMPYYGKCLLKTSDGDTAAFIGENDGRIIAALGFDIHNSDVGLKKEFPLFIYDLSETLVNSGILSRSNYEGGDDINIRSRNSDDSMSIEDPDKIAKLFNYGDKADSVEKLGIFKIIERKDNQEKNTEMFSINFPKNESDISIENENTVNNSKSDMKVLKKNLNLVPVILLIAIAVVFIEWILYLKGN